MRKAVLMGVGALGLSLAGCNQMAAPDANGDADDVAETALADRITIEDMIVRYYAHLGGTSAESFADFFAEDGVFEVNGARYDGRAAITALYAGMREGGAEAQADVPQGKFNMMLTNPVIDVTGNTARASFLWTGVDNDADPAKPPVMREQGREYDLLEKQADGKWLIKHRVVIADSGLPADMRATWQRQADFRFGE